MTKNKKNQIDPQRAKMDQRLERAGLLDYQTQGMSQADVAERYQRAGIRVRDNWFSEHYGDRPGGNYFYPQQNNQLGGGRGGGGQTTPKFTYTFQNGLLTKSPFDPNATQPTMPTPATIGTIQDAVNGKVLWSDVDTAQRKTLLSDPNFYKTNAITKYSNALQQQMLADPNFDWKQLPTWQRIYYGLSSKPAAMGAVQGLVLGAGNPGGAVIGGVLGGIAAKSGYDATKEAWQQGDNKFTFDKQQVGDAVRGAFGWLNFAAEQVEKSIGFGLQVEELIREKKSEEDFRRVFSKAGWNAGAVAFESLTPALKATLAKGKGKLDGTDLLRFLPTAYFVDRLTEMMLRPDQFKGDELVLGASTPVALDKNFQDRIKEARDRIAEGENYREVVMDFQNGIMAQVGDMAGQGILDPLNKAGEAQSWILGKAADATGHKVLAEATRETSGPIEALRRYKTIIQSNQATIIDPKFKADQMSSMAKWVAGLNSQGEIRAGKFTNEGLLTKPSFKKNPLGFIQYMTSLTPETRARIGAGMFYENIGALLSVIDDPHEAGKYIRALANADVDTVAELGARFANSPEFATILPALKEFKADVLDNVMQQWDASEANRGGLLRLADILGQEPSKLLTDLAKNGTAEQDFQRIVARLQASQSPSAKVLLGEIEAGTFTAATLKQIVDIFTGPEAMAWHPGQWKTQILNAMGDHFDAWTVENLGLEPDNKVFRMAHMLKSAQSILLLGGSPGYAINNMLSNMLHRAATGIFGYLTPSEMNGWLERFGMKPARIDEGYGIGGMTDQVSQESHVQTQAMDAAKRGTGPIQWAQDQINKISRGMPFTKLSGKFEQLEGRQGFVIAMKQFWSQSWRRGVGFEKMPAELETALRNAGFQPEHIYARIEASMNQDEILNHLYKKEAGMNAREFVHEAAQAINISSSDAATMLEKVGLLDALDSYMKGDVTKDKIDRAFDRAIHQAQQAIDVAAAQDTIARAEHIKQRTTIEGAKALTDIVTDMELKAMEMHLDHLERMGEAANAVDLADPSQRGNIWKIKYDESRQEYRRFNALRGSTYKGIVDAIGLGDNPHAREWLATLADIDSTMDGAYLSAQEKRNTHFEKWRDDWQNEQQFSERKSIEAQIDREWKAALKRETDNLRKMGDLLGKQYEQLFGVAAGEAARQAWEQIVKFRKEMIARNQEFRANQKAALDMGVPYEMRALAAQEFWQNTYKFMIVEMGKIKQDAIARLDHIARNGDAGPSPEVSPSPTMPPGDATSPAPAPAPAIELQAAAQQRAQTKKETLSAMWDIAEQFSKAQPGDSSNFKRNAFNDKFILFADLKKAEYGGDPNLKTWDDVVATMTPEDVQRILETRQKIKEQNTVNEQLTREARLQNMDEAAKETSRARVKDMNILQAIRAHGGIDWRAVPDVTGEPNAKGWQPGVFSKTGKNRWSLDQMARILADDGYPIDLHNPFDEGGVNQLIDLMQRARAGDKIYTKAHDYDAEIAKQVDAELANNPEAIQAAEEAATAREAEIDQALPSPVDDWTEALAQAVREKDITGIIERMSDMPDELTDVQATPGTDGETWTDYISRVYDEVDAHNRQQEQEVAIATNIVRAQVAMEEMQRAGDVAMTRQLLEEKYRDAFPRVSAEQIANWMDVSDAALETIGNILGKTKEEMYGYYGDIVRDGDPQLSQIAPINRRMSRTEIEDYARVLVRVGEDELRRAIQNEPHLADRIALLDQAHKLNPTMAKKVAFKVLDMLRQDTTIPGTDIAEQLTFRWNTPDEILGLSIPEAMRRRLDLNRQTILDLAPQHKQFIEPLLDSIESEYRWHEGEETRREYGTPQPELALRDLLYRNGADPIGIMQEFKSTLLEQRWYEAFGKTYDFENYSQMLDYRLKNVLFQAAKGGVDFIDGKAIIHAFESGDISTIAHENAHIFLNMMRDAAKRTGDLHMLDDLATVDEWTTLDKVDNVWKAVSNDRYSITENPNGSFTYRDGRGEPRVFNSFEDAQYTLQQEMFARGFEKYLADGQAPTPRLARVFASFKRWLLGIYRAITGSQIDIELSSDMRKVFDRLLGEEKGMQQLIGKDQRDPAYKQLRATWDTLSADEREAALNLILNKTMIDPVSGIESAVAYKMSGQPPEGWIFATSDLNGLTPANDIFGHEAGNQFIGGVGRVAADEVARAGGRVFRTGGDEFTYWFPDQATAESTMRTIDRRVNEMILTLGGQRRTGFSISFGIGDNLEAADKAVYLDKARRIETGQRMTDKRVLPSSVHLVDEPAQVMTQQMPMFDTSPEILSPEIAMPPEVSPETAMPAIEKLRPATGDPLIGGMGKYEDGKFYTVSGREVEIPQPKGGKKANDIINHWLVEEAITEAKTRGNDFVLQMFEDMQRRLQVEQTKSKGWKNPKKRSTLSPADVNLLNDYLFGVEDAANLMPPATRLTTDRGAVLPEVQPELPAATIDGNGDAGPSGFDVFSDAELFDFPTDDPRILDARERIKTLRTSLENETEQFMRATIQRAIVAEEYKIDSIRSLGEMQKPAADPSSPETAMPAEPAPFDEWQNTLFKTRDYAQKLIEAGELDGDEAEKVWSDHQGLVDLIQNRQPTSPSPETAMPSGSEQMSATRTSTPEASPEMAVSTTTFKPGDRVRFERDLGGGDRFGTVIETAYPLPGGRIRVRGDDGSTYQPRMERVQPEQHAPSPETAMTPTAAVSPETAIAPSTNPAKQRNGQFDMFGNGEDLPLFSNTPAPATEEVFTPQPEIKQDSFIDMRPEFGERVENAQVKIKQGIIPEAEPTTPAPVTREKTLIDAITDKLTRGEMWEKSRDFESYIRNLGFDLESEKDLNLAYDLMEGAYNLRARQIRAELTANNAPLIDRIKAMETLEQSLTEARRTLSKMKLQQFSTPLTLSEAAGYVADVRPGDVVGEVTAGTANLVDMFHDTPDVTVKVNEIDEGRREVLKQIGYDPTALNLMAPEWLMEDGKKAPPYATVNISNPPWGSYGTGKYGKPVNIPVKMNDWSQRFAYLTLMRMPDDSRYVGVMPTNWLYTLDRSTRTATVKHSEFYKWLKDNYTVQAVIESPPGAYKQRATDISSLLVVIDKTPHVFANEPIERFAGTQPQTWEEYVNHLESVPKRTQEAVSNAQAKLKPIVAGPDTTGLVDPAARRGESSPDIEHIGKPTDVSDRGSDRPRRTSAERGADNDSGRIETPADRGDAQPDTAEPGRDIPPALVEQRPADVSEPDEGFTYSETFTAKLAEGRAAVRNSTVFTEYVGRSPLGPGEVAHPHPNIVVETKGLAGVPYPDLEEAYRPSAGVMRAMKNRVLSHEGNIDPVWAAIQQNDKHGMGMLIADDVGMGKSRTAAAFVIDRIEKGKKRIVVITKDQQNIANLMNSEFPQVWSGKANEYGGYTTDPGQDFPAKRILVSGQTMKEVKKGTQAIPKFNEPAVYFVSSSEFAQFAPALKELNPDVFVADEAHLFRNVGGADRGAAWTDLHKTLLSNKASILYLTATPGTDLIDLQYLYGLRVWSQDGFGDWIKVITGEQSPEQVKKVNEARTTAEEFAARVEKARDQIQAEPTEMERYGRKALGYKIGKLSFFNDGSTQKPNFVFNIEGESYVRSFDAKGETEAMILTDMVNKKMQANPEIHYSPYDVQQMFRDAEEAFITTFEPPNREQIKSLGDAGITEASDILAKKDQRKWGKKAGPGAFDATLPPAHTEQIMRELKVTGSYMARDISRAGVEFNPLEYKPDAKAKAQMNERINFYREVFEAFKGFGGMNEGPKKFAAMMGISGDIQADAKRALFNMRLPGIIDEAQASLARGEKVVISVVSVGEVDGESGSLLSAINKINVDKIEKIGDGEYSEPEQVPEAVWAVNGLKERLKELPVMPSPIDVLRDTFGDRISFVTGEVSAKDRATASAAFQRDKIDVIVISGAGKTGINLHDITGKRRVHLIVGDYEWSPTNFKQELGRVDRTGQKSSPKVTVMHTGSAGERKFISTISNRMKGLGATSKGGSESTGTGALTDEYELGTVIDKMAVNAMWQELDNSQKGLLLDDYFVDKVNGAKDQVSFKATLDATSEALSRFLKSLQSVPLEQANELLDIYYRERAKLRESNAEADDSEARKTAQNTGKILRQTELGNNLRLTEVTNQEGSKFAILDGVLTPHMNTVKGVLGKGMDVMERFQQGGRGWMKWVQFYDPETNQYVTGLQIKPSSIKDLGDYFGKAIANSHKPETALVDLRAGDKIKVIGSDMHQWELYMGRGGSREGKIIVDYAKIKDRTVLLNNGAVYSAIGNFFHVPPDNIEAFLKRFPIDNAADNPPTLYQDAPILPDANPEMPMGAFEQASGFLPESEVRDEGWQQHVKPLIEAMRSTAHKRINSKPLEGAQRDLSPEGQDMLRRYMQKVQGDMATTKLAATRWGESQRDYAMHNYNRRYGFDKVLETVYPYEFYYTRAMLKWLGNAIDKPQWYSHAARLMRQSSRYENNLPERLRKKIRIPAPWLPEWAGDSIYVDPISNMFPPAQFLQPFEKMQQDQNQQLIEAQRILQEWAQDGTVNQAQLSQAVQTQTGEVWERALAEAKIRRESEISNPGDIMSAMLGPAWYLQAPANAAGIKLPFGISKGDPNAIGTLPITNTARAIDTVTNNSWAEPIGDLIGLVAKPEDYVRRKFQMPTMGEYQDYYIRRQLANMTAEGKLSPEDAQIAMAEGENNPNWKAAEERVKMEMALRVPGAGALYAGLHNGLKGAAEAALPSLWGAGILPAGELEFRGLKDEWQEAWKRYDAGDQAAVNRFFDKHPEYSTYLAKGKKPEEQLRSFLVGQIWDGYMSLGDTNKKAARAQMGELFQEAFLDKETRSYESIDIPTLTQWARMLYKNVPTTPETQPGIDAPADLSLYGPETTQITDEFYRQRTQKFPNYYQDEQGYYNLPKSKQTAYLLSHPQLREYWDWKKKWYTKYPDLKPILNGQAFKTMDVSKWNPALQQYVMIYAMTGQPLPNGASAALKQIWIREGRPNGDFKTWLNTQVVPAMQYQQPQQ